MLTEARRAIEVEHPCVVRVRSADATGGELLVATDYIDGEAYPTLLVAAREHARPITLKLTLRLMCDALAGLSAMHGGTGGARHDRMIFGRLAPDDLIVGADGLTRVIIGARQSRSASSIGYLCPEIALGSDADADERSDVYAVGVILWEAFAQQRLYDESTLEGLVAALLRGGIPVPPLPDDAPWADPVIDVVMRAVAPDPGDRYVSAGAMLEALLEAAGRRVGTAGDIVELVESLVGPFIRARRREASMPAAASNSDIRATTPDREDETLRPKQGEQEQEPELVTEVDFKNPLLLTQRDPDTTTIPAIRDLSGDSDELKTEVHPDLARALPRARSGDAVVARGRPTFAEDPSITSTLPPEMKRDLIAKQRQLGEDAPTITKSVATADGVLAMFDEDPPEQAEEVKSALDDGGSISVTDPGPIRPRADSIVTLDRPGGDGEASIVTARRPAPTMESRETPVCPPGSGDEDVEELLAKTASLDRSAFPTGPPLILEETVNMEQAAEMRRAISSVDATIDLRRQQERFVGPGDGSFGVRRTVPLAIVPMPPPDYGSSPHLASPSAPPVVLPSQPIASQHYIPPPVFAPPPSASRFSLTEETTKSSALLGVLTFFLVLASLLVLAWLTYPYWRAWAGL
jgi:eukaryotic-like serine/threonine-protein kinase